MFLIGLVDPGELLANIEAQISKVKAEALSRKEIMDRIERWLSACEEENWLEDYSLVMFFSFTLKLLCYLIFRNRLNKIILILIIQYCTSLRMVLE